MIKQRLRFARDVYTVNRSTLFDAAWYLQRYAEATATGIHPAIHFLTEGWQSGFDPGPDFSTSWYLEQNPNVWASGINPLLHYLRGGAAEGRLPHPEQTTSPVPDGTAGTNSSNGLIRDGALLISSFLTGYPSGRPVAKRSLMREPRYVRGNIETRPAGKTVLVCAHASGRQLFGAERSLLYLLEMMNRLGVNVVSTLPTPNPDYERAIADLCEGVYVFPYPQWSKDFSEIEEVVRSFENVIEKCNADVVHVNTIMPREALTAANRLQKVSVIHARELITGDARLADAIGELPTSIVSMVLERADFIIANSSATAKCYGGSERVFVVRNCVDVEQLDIPNIVDPDLVCIALIGSSSRKKGIDDFLELAEALQGRVTNAKLLVIGARPEADEIRWNSRPDNLAYAGYVHGSGDAIAQANIVVSLSHVPESFGRTVAEALAARRPVIAYDHGAVKELITHGESGFLVPVGDVSVVAEHIEWLCSNTDRIGLLGERGRIDAISEIGPQETQHQLAAAYDTILSAINR